MSIERDEYETARLGREAFVEWDYEQGDFKLAPNGWRVLTVYEGRNDYWVAPVVGWVRLSYRRKVYHRQPYEVVQVGKPEDCGWRPVIWDVDDGVLRSDWELDERGRLSTPPNRPIIYLLGPDSPLPDLPDLKDDLGEWAAQNIKPTPAS